MSKEKEEIKEKFKELSNAINEKYGTGYPSINDKEGWKLLGRAEGLAWCLSDVVVNGEEKESPFLVEKSGSVSSPTKKDDYCLCGVEGTVGKCRYHQELDNPVSFLQRINDKTLGCSCGRCERERLVVNEIRSIFLLCLKELEKKSCSPSNIVLQERFEGKLYPVVLLSNIKKVMGKKK